MSVRETIFESLHHTPDRSRMETEEDPETEGGMRPGARYDDCESCEGTGFLIMNEDDYAPEALGDVQACDCGILRTDEDAADAARAAGYRVQEKSGDFVAIRREA